MRAEIGDYVNSFFVLWTKSWFKVPRGRANVVFHALWCLRTQRIEERKRQLEGRAFFRFEAGAILIVLILVVVFLKEYAKRSRSVCQ